MEHLGRMLREAVCFGSLGHAYTSTRVLVRLRRDQTMQA
jgi:hypothetical protein